MKKDADITPTENLTSLFLYANEPDALTVQKMEFLANESPWRICLVFWHRVNSLLSIQATMGLPSENVTCISGKVGLSWIAKVFYRLAIMVRFVVQSVKLRPAVIHACTLDMLLVGFVVRALRPGTKLIFDLQDTSDGMLHPLMLWIQRFLFRRCSVIFVTSKRFHTHFLREFRLVNEGKVPVIYVPNTPLSERFSAFNRRVPDTEIVIGCFGTFRSPNALEALIQTAGILRAKRVNASVLFAGTGISRPLVERAARANPHIRYSGSYDYQRDIKNLYERIDLVYAVYDSSHNKGIALACRLAEAVVCGLPVIVNSDTYMGEIVQELGIGFYVGQDIVGDLTAIVEKFSADPSLRSKVTAACEKARSQFLFDTYKPRIREAYDNLFSNKH
ncbi:MAG: glycosyltransferase family 4 protein [Verrucomicrobia bacterium]|nr:MAG: glycosyltransferase family 4 protein [Verrucomicrobiota bacterium]